MRARPRRTRGLRDRGESGVAAIVVCLFIVGVVFPLSALSVDVARWYVESSRMQNAADAAALAGVTYLPADMSEAVGHAQDTATENGYGPRPGRTVTVVQGREPTQLKVTITDSVTNPFGATFGAGRKQLTVTATADFNAPAPMGSPCNALGNEPVGTTARGPVGSQLVPPTGATCFSTPQFWANMHGPNVQKTQGDRYAVRYCRTGEDGCSGTVNTEFDPQGYFYIVRVGKAAVDARTPITLQVYDPAYAPTGSRCSAPANVTANGWNNYTPDALSRYATGPGLFCAGDDANSNYRVGTSTPTITSFGLRAPAETFRPDDAPPITTCARQFKGYGSVSAGALQKGNTSYNDDLASVFHQWVPLCSFTPTVAGDYYLQVRTNVPLGGAEVLPGMTAGNQTVFDQTGDNTSVTGTGSNRFALRAIGTAPAVSQAVAISGWNRMTIYANTDAATSEFNLVRVIPNDSAKTVDFSFFDAGDASNGSATITLLPPVESSLKSLTSCTGSGKVNGALSGCQVTGISASAGWDGKTQHIKATIPASYTCNTASIGGCWFRVRVAFPSGSTVTDVTTWTADVGGDPVRLIE